MTDRREAILDQLKKTITDIDFFATVYRNKDEVAESAKPAVVILDGNEVAEDDPNVKPPPGTSGRSTMTPEIYVLLDSDIESVGTDLNEARARILKAVLTDATLASIVGYGRGGFIKYRSTETALAKGRKIEGQALITFDFTYVIKPAELTQTYD